jgi:hypothetical protein
MPEHNHTDHSLYGECKACLEEERLIMTDQLPLPFPEPETDGWEEIYDILQKFPDAFSPVGMDGYQL